MVMRTKELAVEPDFGLWDLVAVEILGGELLAVRFGKVRLGLHECGAVCAHSLP